MLFISEVENTFKGKVVDFKRFQDLFQPNGYDGLDKLSFRFYMSEPEDEKALFAAYQIEDPRPFDLADDEEDEDLSYDDEESDEDDDEDFSINYEDFPYPDISVFVGLKKQDDAYIIDSIDICKVYPSNWPSPGTHASSFTNLEAEYVFKRLSPILKV